VKNRCIAPLSIDENPSCLPEFYPLPSTIGFNFKARGHVLQYFTWVIPVAKSPSLFNLCSLAYGGDRNDGCGSVLHQKRLLPGYPGLSYILYSSTDLYRFEEPGIFSCQSDYRTPDIQHITDTTVLIVVLRCIFLTIILICNNLCFNAYIFLTM